MTITRAKYKSILVRNWSFGDYPKRHGETGSYRGQDLFSRLLAWIAEYKERAYQDEDRLQKALALLPEVYNRCRRNAGY